MGGMGQETPETECTNGQLSSLPVALARWFSSECPHPSCDRNRGPLYSFRDGGRGTVLWSHRNHTRSVSEGFPPISPRRRSQREVHWLPVRNPRDRFRPRAKLVCLQGGGQWVAESLRIRSVFLRAGRPRLRFFMPPLPLTLLGVCLWLCVISTLLCHQIRGNWRPPRRSPREQDVTGQVFEEAPGSGEKGAGAETQSKGRKPSLQGRVRLPRAGRRPSTAKPGAGALGRCPPRWAAPGTRQSGPGVRCSGT